MASHRLTSSLSLQDGAPNLRLGEYVLIRIPELIRVGGQVADEATAGTALPRTSNEGSPQHFAFVRWAIPHTSSSYLLEVYPVVSFSTRAYNEMDEASQATLLPLPPLSLRHPMPEAFGPPLDFGNWSSSRDSWLSIIPRRFLMPTSRPFKRMNPRLIMPLSVLDRIDNYRKTLCSNKEGEKGPEQFSVETAHDILVLEGVDEDVEGADATARDELIMLARDSPMWREELRKYLEREEKEREQVQEERATRLTHWLEDTTAQPT